MARGILAVSCFGFVVLRLWVVAAATATASEDRGPRWGPRPVGDLVLAVPCRGGLGG
jgi:hypothetical protein